MKEEVNYPGKEEQRLCTRSQVQAAQMACSNAAAVCSNAAAISKGFIKMEQRKLATKALVESKFSGRKMGG